MLSPQRVLTLHRVAFNLLLTNPMRRELSKNTTLSSKLLRLGFGLIIFVAGIKILLDQIMSYETLAAQIYVTIWLLLWTFFGTKLLEQAWSQKNVFIQNNQIIISNHFKEIVIHKSDIDQVSEKKFSRVGLVVYLKLKTSSQFGSEISFIPLDYRKPTGGSQVIRDIKNEV